MTLNAPYAATELLLDREFFEMLKGKKVFCGMKNTLLKAGDYFKELTLFRLLQAGGIRGKKRGAYGGGRAGDRHGRIRRHDRWLPVLSDRLRPDRKGAERDA